jgi:outer membrane lipopolysaccharide assembly protein LptE/RlpB
VTVLATLAALGLSACGYHLHAGVYQLPDGGKRLRIPIARNRTVEAFVGAWLTDELRREADRVGLEVSGAAGAPALFARVNSVSEIPRGVALTAGLFRTREQEVVVEVELRLKLGDGRRWKVILSDRESYLSAVDLRGTETNRQLGIQRVLGRLARTGLERLGRNF